MIQRPPQLALLFAGLSMLAFGGGAGVIPDIQRAVVDHYHWMTAREFLDTFAISRAMPGPGSLIVVLIGAGGRPARRGGFLPGDVRPVLPDRLHRRPHLHRAGRSPWRAVVERGLAPVAVGMTFASGLALMRGTESGWLPYTITIASTAAFAFTEINPIALLGPQSRPCIRKVLPPRSCRRARRRPGSRMNLRPHFFSGVATVVAKLLLQCEPDVALFGEKDFQQLKVVTRLARDLSLPTRIVGAPTAREPDGLALSSRNAYLSQSERQTAPALYRSLCDCAVAIRGGESIAGVLAERAKRSARPDSHSIISKRAMPRRWRRSAMQNANPSASSSPPGSARRG